MKKVVLFLFLFCISQWSLAQQSKYGIQINTYPLHKSKFTSLILENDKPIKIKGKKTELKFDLWLRSDNIIGSVLRIITDKGVNIDLIYSVAQNDERFPILVVKDDIYPIGKNTRKELWIPVSISFDPSVGIINAKYDNSEINIKTPHIKDVKNIKIAFGFCPFENFIIRDVASINIKDISIKRDEKEIRFWRMGKHDNEICYDELANIPAITQNAHWIIDQYITWKKEYDNTFSNFLSIAFDSINGTFFMTADKDEIHTYQVESGISHIVYVSKGENVANYPNQLIYISSRKQLLSYNLDENIYSPFNFRSQSWEGNTPPIEEHDYWNNSIIYNQANSSLISFGGYGHYRFNNELLISYPWEDRPQYKVLLKDIHPRRTSSIALVDSLLYIFGGEGSPSGRQELLSRYYYDFYVVNLQTEQVKKLWENSLYPKENGEFQPCENMVYDKNKNCFYFFSTQQGGILMKINAQENKIETMSYPLGASIEAQYIYTNLYHYPKQKKLYAVIQLSDIEGKSKLTIYAIDYPTLSTKEWQQSSSPYIYTLKLLKSNNSLFFMIVISIVFISIVLFLLKRKRKVKEKTRFFHHKVPNNVDTTTLQLQHYDLSKGCIRLFGGFLPLDKEGNDLSHLFTPTLKSLLIMLILHTGANNKGISGHKMIQLLWFDKTEGAAKNNRNVYISKLRNILEQVGDIKIVNQSSFWSIHFGEDTLCDYLEALKWYKSEGDEGLEELLELLLHGTILPNTEVDWIDKFKSDFSNMTIDFLIHLLNKKELSDNLRIRIADTLFQHDNISEEALKEKCKTLYKQGKKGLAINVYETFCRDYGVSLGIPYKHSFLEVIK